MKKISKMLSAALSLTLCAALVMPSFAAVALNKDEHIDETGALKENSEGNYDYYLDGDVKLDRTLVIKEGTKATIDLNGYTLKLNESVEAVVDAAGKVTGVDVDNGGDPVLTGAVIKVQGPTQYWKDPSDTHLTIKDKDEDADYEHGEGTGTITGGNNTSGNGVGGGISLSGGAGLTMEGGKVSGNAAAGGGGGIGTLPNQRKGGSIKLEDVEVSDNVVYNAANNGYYSGGGGGGILVRNYEEIEIEDTEIKENKIGTGGAGGGLYAFSCDEISIEETKIEENVSGHYGGGVYLEHCGGDVTLDDVSIQNNAVKDTYWAGGVYVLVGAIDNAPCNITMKNNTVIANNTTNFNGDFRNDVFMTAYGKDISLTMDESWDAKLSDGSTFKEWQSQSSGVAAPGKEGTYTLSNGSMGMCSLWNAHVHSYEEEITTTPTCTEKGEKTFTCACGDHYTVPIDPLGHDMGEWVVTKQPGPGVKGEEQRECEREGCDYKETRELPALPSNLNPGGTTIEEPEVPLAGLFTRADAIGYLWEQSGEPEWELSDFPDVPEDHEWAVAIGWAQDMGIALADKDGNFRPDDLVLRSVESLEISPEGELQEFLNRYAVYAGVELDADELFIELEGAWDDIIMGEDAQVIFDEFFAKLEAALNAAA